MAKQLELDFNPKSEDIKDIEKGVPDFKKHGFQSRDEWLKAKAHDRAWRHMEEMGMVENVKGGKK